LHDDPIVGRGEAPLLVAVALAEAEGDMDMEEEVLLVYKQVP
jgi:tellurite resistance protein